MFITVQVEQKLYILGKTLDLIVFLAKISTLSV